MSPPLTLLTEIASGGQASVHAALRGDRVVAVKRVRAGASASSLVDEARVASRIRHPNVVETIDVVEHGGEVLLVMEYVAGLSLSELGQLASRALQPMPIDVAVGIVAQALEGLSAAHAAVDDDGQPLEVVHRDLSPDNLLIDGDGRVTVLDFGIARARGRMQPTTEVGTVKGKLGYLAPEQLYGDASVQSDVWAMGVVLWELLAGRRLFSGDSEPAALARALTSKIPPPSELRGGIGPELDATVLAALQRTERHRLTTARAFAEKLAPCGGASRETIAAWVRSVASERLQEAAALGSARAPVQRSRTRRIAFFTQTTRFRAVLLGAALLIALGGAATGWFLRPVPELVPSIAPVVTEPPVTAIAAPTPVEPEPTPEPKAEPKPVLSRKRPTRQLKPKAEAPKCDPPWVLDAQGHKQYRRECFR